MTQLAAVWYPYLLRWCLKNISQYDIRLGWIDFYCSHFSIGGTFVK